MVLYIKNFDVVAYGVILSDTPFRMGYVQSFSVVVFVKTNDNFMSNSTKRLALTV